VFLNPLRPRPKGKGPNLKAKVGNILPHYGASFPQHRSYSRFRGLSCYCLLRRLRNGEHLGLTTLLLLGHFLLKRAACALSQLSRNPAKPGVPRPTVRRLVPSLLKILRRELEPISAATGSGRVSKICRPELSACRNRNQLARRALAGFACLQGGVTMASSTSTHTIRDRRSMMRILEHGGERSTRAGARTIP